MNGEEVKEEGRTEEEAREEFDQTVDREEDEQHLLAERDTAGRFLQGKSGNPSGRPKGSKNKVTLLKLMAEESVRGRNIELMQDVADKVIRDALEGDKDMMKLVWQSIVSKGASDEKSTGKEKVEININPPAKVEEVIVINQEESQDAE